MGQLSAQAQRKLGSLQIVAFAPNAWSGQWMNRQQLLSRLAPYTNVVYSQGIPTIWQIDSARQLLRQPLGRHSEANRVVLDQPSSLLFRWPRFRRVSEWALKTHSRHLGRKLKSSTPTVLYIFHPQYADYVDLVDHQLLVYHPYDDFSKQRVDEKRARSEARLLDQADLVITPSVDVSVIMMERSGRDDVCTVQNGVDFDAFSQAQRLPCPEDLAKIRKPTIGYIGSINIKVDIALLDFLAQRLPEVQQVLIGPIGKLGEKRVLFEKLQGYDNVTYLGAKRYDQLPAYAGHIDCHLMCYDTSPELWARLAYPLKLNEYLASGKPLLSCPLNSVEDQASIMDVCTTPEQWLERVQERISGESEKVLPGYQYAARQSWNHRVEQLVSLLDQAMTNKR